MEGTEAGQGELGCCRDGWAVHHGDEEPYKGGPNGGRPGLLHQRRRRLTARASSRFQRSGGRAARLHPASQRIEEAHQRVSPWVDLTRRPGPGVLR